MPPKDNVPVPNEVFADGVGWIGLHGGVVRMEFFSFGTPGHPDGTSEKDKEPDRIVRQRIVMPIEGFMRSLAAMNDLVRKLESGGLIVRRPGAAVAGDQAAKADARTASPASSPNFD